MGDQGPLKVLAEGIGHPLRVGAGLRDLSAARRPLLQPAHWGLSCPRLRAPSHPWVEVAPSWVSGCCPFPREPAQTRVHIHTHGRCRRPHQASVCPHSHLLPRPPGFQARSSHGLSHPRSLPPLPQSWSPAPPGCSGPSPGRPGRVGASCGGPAAVRGQRRLVPLHQCQGRRAWLSARLAPQSAVLQNRGSPGMLLGKICF